jgi:transmembrane 9 superfamily protein 2/4
MTVEQMAAVSFKVKDNYFVNMVVDNIPVAEEFVLVNPDDTPEKQAASREFKLLKGFPLGFVRKTAGTKTETAYINNHIRMRILYHEDAESFEGSRIVGFIAEAHSVRHTVDGQWSDDKTKLTTCNPTTLVTDSSNPMPVDGPLTKLPGGSTIIYTYDVSWEASEIKWASRWDLYLKMTDTNIHWFAITNSIIVTLLLTTVVAATFVRTLRGDLEKYNDMDKDEALEESGWKLVHGEVFRPPKNGAFLCVLVGTGCQIFAMATVMLGFACLGFLSPSNRGGLMTALLLLFVFFGMIAGYVSTRMYKMFGLTDWKRNTVTTALFFPGVTFSTFFVLNLFVWGQKSSGAVPFTTLLALLTLWLGISAPLVYLGSFFAFKKDAIKPPLRVNNIPRMLPPDDKRPFFSTVPSHSSCAPLPLLRLVPRVSLVSIAACFVAS